MSNCSIFPAIVVNDDDAGPSSNIHLSTTCKQSVMCHLMCMYCAMNKRGISTSIITKKYTYNTLDQVKTLETHSKHAPPAMAYR